MKNFRHVRFNGLLIVLKKMDYERLMSKLMIISLVKWLSSTRFMSSNVIRKE